MREKKQKINQKGDIKKHVFEIHTMEGDNENKKFISQVDVAVKKPEFVDAKQKEKNIETQKQTQQLHQKQEKAENIKLPVKPVNYIKQTNTTENPLLDTKKVETQLDKSSKGVFAPTAGKSDIEKINKLPKDMLIKDEKTSEQKPKKKKSPKKEKKKKGGLMTVLIVVVLMGFVAVMGYSKKENIKELFNVKTDPQIEPHNDVINEEVNVETPSEEESITQIYSSEFPNYFSIDVESDISQENIATELEAIGENMKKEGMGGPISFIVTDVNNNPVSFHVFAMSAGMDIPQDIMIALEENFEIYAFDDIGNGIRFGFMVDIKDKEALEIALNPENEVLLPKAFDIVLNGIGATAMEIIFGDSVYESHSIRFDNLDEEKTYSVDYTISNERWIIGTSKNTMRAMIDTSKKEKNQEKVMDAGEELSTSSFTDSLRVCDVFTETFEHPLTGGEMKRSILGKENGACLYEEEMPTGGIMKCEYNDNLLIAVADYYKALQKAENISVDINISTNEEKTKSVTILDGEEVENILQYALDKEFCVVYDIDGNKL